MCFLHWAGFDELFFVVYVFFFLGGVPHPKGDEFFFGGVPHPKGDEFVFNRAGFPIQKGMSLFVLKKEHMLYFYWAEFPIQKEMTRQTQRYSHMKQGFVIGST